MESKDISFEQLEELGNLVECREDLDYEERSFDLIKEIISHLANPDLYGEYNIEKNKWLDKYLS